MPKALEGIKILDLSQFEAGPSCTELLGFLGADVIKVEVPGKGDPGRKSIRDKYSREKDFDSWFFLYLNANKRSITLNLKSPEGVAIFKEMVKKADVVISNFTLGTMDKLGVGYSVLSKINPGIVNVECTGFGKGGPYSHYLAFDPVAKAAGSSMSVTGEPDGAPMNYAPNVGDTGAGLHMSVAILAALLYRNKTGEGQDIDMSMTDNVVNQTRTRISGTMVENKPEKRTGTVEPTMTPNGVYRCKGGGPNDYIYIFGVNHYENLMKAIGREDLLGELLDSLDKRNERGNEVRKAITDWTMQRSKMEAFHTIARAKVPCGPVLDTLEVLNDEHLVKRGFIAEVTHPERGKYKMPGCAIKMSKSPVDYIHPPLLGEHNEEVYREWLGYSKKKVAELKEKKVI